MIVAGLRLRRQPSATGPRLLFAADGPNVLEHYDALLHQLEGRADVVVFEPPGTGGSHPPRGFDFTIDALTRACLPLLDEPRTLVFPCYLGFVAQALARQVPERVTRLVLPQVVSWPQLSAWADGVDPRRLIRTRGLGQLIVRLTRRRTITSWYRASTGHPRFREPFVAAAFEALDAGGCFCLAHLMQGLERSAPPPHEQPTMPTAIVWGPRDRTHRRSDPNASCPGAEVCASTTAVTAPSSKIPWASRRGCSRGMRGLHERPQRPRRARARRRG